MPSIVTVNVSVTEAPTPNTLLGTGAMISQGATNTSPGTKTLLTQPSSLTPILGGSKTLATLTQATGLATATATLAHGFTVGDTLEITIAGATPVAYNGTFLCTVTTTTAFTYAVPSGTASSATGSPAYTVEDVAELSAMVNTFFSQGGNTAVYVLELGAGSASDGVAALGAWITANPPGIPQGNGFYGFYSYLVPRTWDANSDFLTLLASYESTTALTYFWVTTTLATYSAYTAQMKCVKAMIEAPTYGVWPANALTAISYTGGLATATTTAAHGIAVGQWFQISGCTPAGYNGWWQAVTGTTGSTLVYAIATNPGAESALGTLVQSQYSSAGVPATEFSRAAGWHVTLSYAPSSSNRVTPYNYSFVYGVTPFPTQGNNALLTTLLAANIEVVGTGAEGGLSNTIAYGGNFLDGNTVNWWYAIDWLNINSHLNLANFVINGSNNPQAPLYLNQDGINSGQAVVASTISSGITFGMIFGSLAQVELSGPAFAAASSAGTYAGQAVVNAVPFATYYAASPSDYKIGLYGGYSISFTPQRGFDNIVLNINATQFVG
jgi:hypothetical protein